MTTVAWHRDHGLAADTMIVGDFKAFFHKLRRMKGGRSVGFAGDPTYALSLVRWIENGAVLAELPTFPENEDTGFELLIVAADGSITWWNEAGVPLEVNEPFYAIGTGAQAALTAMHLGKTPAQAVRLAMKVDEKTGLGVETLGMKKRKKR